MTNHKQVFSEEHVQITYKIDPLTQIFATSVLTMQRVTHILHTLLSQKSAHDEEMAYCVVCECKIWTHIVSCI